MDFRYLPAAASTLLSANSLMVSTKKEEGSAFIYTLSSRQSKESQLFF